MSVGSAFSELAMQALSSAEEAVSGSELDEQPDITATTSASHGTNEERRALYFADDLSTDIFLILKNLELSVDDEIPLNTHFASCHLTAKHDSPLCQKNTV